MRELAIRLPVLMLVAVLAVRAGAAEPKPMKVFILAGQSNMVGQAVVDLEGKDYNGGKGTLVALSRDPAKRDLVRHLFDDQGRGRVRDDVFVRFGPDAGAGSAPVKIGPLAFEVTAGLMPPPAYFPLNVALNKQGYDSIDEVMQRGTQPLSPRAFEAAANETGALVLDTRDAESFSKSFVPNSINIGIDGQFAPWVGALIPDVKQELLIIAEPGREEEVVTRLARVGYDYCLGYLDGGMEAWKAAGMETDSIQRISADHLAEIVARQPDARIFDVRKESEFKSEHLLNAENAPLDFLNDSMALIPKDQTAYIHCAGGYRSMIFASALRARGYDNLIEVRGGFKALKESNRFELTDYVCPTTLL